MGQRPQAKIAPWRRTHPRTRSSPGRANASGARSRRRWRRTAGPSPSTIASRRTPPASAFQTDSVATLSRAEWDKHLEVNLRAPFVLTQEFARQLPDGLEGNVINLLDQRVWNLTPHFLAYTASKSGLWTLTRTLALALAPRIRVNGIGPGPALASRYQSAAQFEAQCATLPLRHSTSPEEIARAVRHILDLPSMTGQMIALDGGQHLNWASPLKHPLPGDW